MSNSSQNINWKPSFSFFALIGLHLAPALITFVQFKLFALWIIGAVLFVLALQLFISTQTPAKRWIAALLSAVLAIGSASLYTSLLFQGSGFNEQFFLHYNLESLKVGFGQFLPLILINAVYIALCAIAALRLKPLQWPSPKAGLAALAASLIAALTLAPLTSAANYILTKNDTIDIKVQAVVRNRAPVMIEPTEVPLKNIVLIYAEGLEATYLNKDIFPGLMPRLNALRAQAADYTNVQQVMNTQWTIAGIVASQCSVPFNVGRIYGEANVALASVEKPFGKELCIGDILKAYGYDNTFMGGAGMAFAGKGKFLKTHGYDTLLGRSVLSKRQTNKGYVSGWGLYDDELIQFLGDEITEKSASASPYMITALTLDTHQPEGHPSKSCAHFPLDPDPMLQSVYCSDQILGTFIEDSLQSEAAENTVYILFSDHLSNRNTVYDTLQAHQDERRLTFMAWGAGIKPQTHVQPLTHFDVAPTILEWAGVPNYRNHNWGRSVAKPRAGLWYGGENDLQASAEDVTYIDDNDGFDDISVTLDPIEITVGESVYKASYAGDTLKHRIYVVLFDEAGDVESIGFYGSKKYLDLAKVDNWFIAVSGTPAVGHFTDEQAATHKEGALYYYLGRVGSDNPVTGVIEERLDVSAADVQRLINGTKENISE